MNALGFMSNAMVAKVPAVLIAVSLANLPSSSSQGSDSGSFLANRYGSTCSGFIDAADTSDPVKLQSYKNTIIRLVQQKWGSLSDDKLRRLVRKLVIHCEVNGRSDFETAAKRVIARSG
jgi:hypothetical protein